MKKAFVLISAILSVMHYDARAQQNSGVSSATQTEQGYCYKLYGSGGGFYFDYLSYKSPEEKADFLVKKYMDAKISFKLAVNDIDNTNIKKHRYLILNELQKISDAFNDLD